MDNACWVGEKRECLPSGLSVLWGLVFHPVPKKGKIKSFDSQETLIRSRGAFVMCCQICSDALTHVLERKINNLITALSGCPKARDSLNYLSAARAVWLLPPVYSSERVLSIRNASLPPFHRPFQPVLSLLHNYPVSRHFSVLPLNLAWLHASQLLPRLWGCRDHTAQHQWQRHHGDIPGATEADISKYEAAPEPNWRLEC